MPSIPRNTTVELEVTIPSAADPAVAEREGVEFRVWEATPTGDRLVWFRLSPAQFAAVLRGAHLAKIPANVQEDA